MNFYVFYPGRSEPEEALPMELAIQLFKAAAKWKPKATMDSFAWSIAIMPGKVHSPDASFPLKDGYIAVVLHRGDKHLVDIGYGQTLGVGVTPRGKFKYRFGADADLTEQSVANAVVPRGVDEWLQHGERGKSSEAMCFALYAVPKIDLRDMASHPHDPADFARCHKFLEYVPEARARLAHVAKLSPTWNLYVENWEQLTQLYHAESVKREAPELYGLMQRLQKQAQQEQSAAHA